jgi:DNA-binding transcriptional LysR family regulator
MAQRRKKKEGPHVSSASPAIATAGDDAMNQPSEAPRTMFLRGLDLNLLVALDVLLQERHVTRASARLFRSQPAVSAMLARLREYFGDELMRRNGRDIELTPLATELVGPLRDFIERAEGLIGMHRASSFRELERTFTVSMSDSVCDFLMVPLLEHLAQAAPRVVIRAKSIDQASADVALERGETDFVIAPTLALFDDKLDRYVIDDLYEERLVCIGDRDRIDGADVQDIDKFSRMPFIAVRFNNAAQVPMAEVPFERLGISRNIRAYVPYFQQLPPLVEHSDRIAIVHERTALAAMGRYNIAVFEPPMEIPPLELKLISHGRNQTSLQYQWLRSSIQEVCAAAVG